MLGWFHAMMPKDERFFDLFARHSQAVVAGAEALRAMLDGGDAVPRHYRTIMEREQDADNVTRDVLIAVRRTFITPFDRGDIQDLITSMDNTIDQMQKTAKAVMLFDIRSFTPQMKEMGDAIVKCAVLVEEAVPLLALDQQGGRPHQRADRADHPDRGARRRPARRRPQGAVRDARRRQPDGLHHRQRGLRPSREGGRSLRRRRQRAAERRHRSRLTRPEHEDGNRRARTAAADRARSRSRCCSTSSTGCTTPRNSIATIVSTRVLKPQYAVVWAAFFNFIAFLFFGLHVAQTIGTGIIDAERRHAARRSSAR